MYVWNNFTVGSPAYALIHKLKHTKVAVKTWNTYHFGHIQTKIDAILHKLDDIQYLIQTPHSFNTKLLLKQEPVDLLVKEEIV